MIFLIQKSPSIFFVSRIVRWILYHYTTWDTPCSIVSQHKIYSFTVLQVRGMKWILRVWNQVIGSSVSFLLEDSGEHLFPYLFQLPEDTCIPWLLSPCSVFKSPQFHLYHAILFFCLWLSCFPHKEPSVYIGAYMDNVGYSFYLWYLIYMLAKSLLQYKMANNKKAVIHSFWGFGYGHLWGIMVPHYSVYSTGSKQFVC